MAAVLEGLTRTRRFSRTNPLLTPCTFPIYPPTLTAAALFSFAYFAEHRGPRIQGRSRDVYFFRYRHPTFEGHAGSDVVVSPAPIAAGAAATSRQCLHRGERRPCTFRVSTWRRGDRRRLRGFAGDVSGSQRHVHAGRAKRKLAQGGRAHTGTGGQEVGD